MLLDPSWLLDKDLLDCHTGPQTILFPFQGAVYGRQTNIHEILMRLRSVQIHNSELTKARLHATKTIV